MTANTDPSAGAPPPLSGATALFLDFDGTLAPIAARPQDVQVPDWVRPTLRALDGRLDGALAIVSGRPIAQLDDFLAPLRLIAAGAHGAEWRDVQGTVHQVTATPPEKVVRQAHDLAARHAGLILEPKPSGLSLHYRARPELEAECRDTLFAALAASPGADTEWEWLHGQFVYELKQRAVSKGSAVQLLLRQTLFAGRQPVFVGDDRTDEDGIAAVQAAGGYGVRVGGGVTRARYRLADPASVGAWLGGVVDHAPQRVDAPKEDGAA
ncbi:Trehalose 6-phosphate phosphatase OS=Rhizobacter sp. Root404 OX=1736528 GN=ASC76_10710 PE=3 SV=1 [Rhizobacter fulvus]